MFEIYDDFASKWVGDSFTTYGAAEDYVCDYLKEKYNDSLLAEGLDIWDRFIIYQRWS